MYNIFKVLVKLIVLLEKPQICSKNNNKNVLECDNFV